MIDLSYKKWSNNTIEIVFSNTVDNDNKLIKILNENKLISRVNDTTYEESLTDVNKVEKVITKKIDGKFLIFEDDFIKVSRFKEVCRRYSSFTGKGNYYNNSLNKINFNFINRLDIPEKLLRNIIVEMEESTSRILKVSPDLFSFLELNYPSQKEQFMFYKNLFSMALFSNKIIIKNNRIKLIYFGANGKRIIHEIPINKYKYFKNDAMYSIFNWFCDCKIDDFVKKEIIKHFF